MRIVAVGDVVLDVLVKGDVDVARDARGAVRIAAGGSAANFAVAAARAGAHATFFGRVGDDVAGRLLVAELERAGVVVRARATEGASTGQVLVMRDGVAGASRMISDPGASALLAPEDLDPDAIARADLLHLTGYSWLREGPARAAHAALDAARSRGGPRPLVSFDPGPAHLIEAYGAARLRADLASARFDLLFPNLEEGVATTCEQEPRAIALALASTSRLVALKLGAEGCLVAQGTRVDHVPAAPAHVVDTTGAGAAFAAAFATRYLATADPLASARAGAEAAASVVGRVGSR